MTKRDGGGDTPESRIAAAAKRALAEAEARRKALDGETGKAGEVGGRDGPEPVRFGDWEAGGRAVDF